MHWSTVLMLFFLGSFGLLTLLLVVNSLQEGERRAAGIGLGALTVLLGLAVTVWVLGRRGLPDHWHVVIYLIDAAFLAGIVLLLLPTGRNPSARKGTACYTSGEVRRFDERETVFARIRSLRPGAAEYEEYYRLHPQQRENDDKRRSMGGPLGTPGRIDRKNVSNLAMLRTLYNFPLILGKPEMVRPRPAEEVARIPADELTTRVKGFARALGADLVGVTRLNPLWVYSHRGEVFYDNWEDWGKEVDCGHTFAIVMATEMRREMIMARPHTPVAIESTRNYGLGAYISVQVARLLAELGYAATAHHFRHYEVLCVPLAVDAGLGELGRNGYLITREFGPRVRLAAVTTNAPLLADRPVDLGIQHFCAYCRKCADLCPSRSIPRGDKTEVNGLRRWKLDADACSAWWARVGTDCCICMAVCPWSHPRTLVHRVGTFLATRSAVARRVLIQADDLLYGDYKGRWFGPRWCDYRWEKNLPPGATG